MSRADPKSAVIFKGCSKFGDEPSYHRKEERKITALTIIKKTPIVTRWLRAFSLESTTLFPHSLSLINCWGKKRKNTPKIRKKIPARIFKTINLVISHHLPYALRLLIRRHKVKSFLGPKKFAYWSGRLWYNGAMRCQR